MPLDPSRTVELMMAEMVHHMAAMTAAQNEATRLLKEVLMTMRSDDGSSVPTSMGMEPGQTGRAIHPSSL